MSWSLPCYDNVYTPYQFDLLEYLYNNKIELNKIIESQIYKKWFNDNKPKINRKYGIVMSDIKKLTKSAVIKTNNSSFIIPIQAGGEPDLYNLFYGYLYAFDYNVFGLFKIEEKIVDTKNKNTLIYHKNSVYLVEEIKTGLRFCLKFARIDPSMQSNYGGFSFTQQQILTDLIKNPHTYNDTAIQMLGPSHDINIDFTYINDNTLDYLYESELYYILNNIIPQTLKDQVVKIISRGVFKLKSNNLLELASDRSINLSHKIDNIDEYTRWNLYRKNRDNLPQEGVDEDIPCFFLITEVDPKFVPYYSFIKANKENDQTDEINHIIYRLIILISELHNFTYKRTQIRFIHNDLHFNNFLVDKKGYVKLFDFDFSCLFNIDTKKPNTKKPIMFNNKHYDKYFKTLDLTNPLFNKLYEISQKEENLITYLTYLEYAHILFNYMYPNNFVQKYKPEYSYFIDLMKQKFSISQSIEINTNIDVPNNIGQWMNIRFPYLIIIMQLFTNIPYTDTNKLKRKLSNIQETNIDSKDIATTIKLSSVR